MPQRRCLLVAMLALVLLTVLVGAPVVRTPLLTAVAPLALPAAAGLPVGVPPLWLPTSGPLTFWVIDTVAVLVLVIVAAVVLRCVQQRHPDGGRGRSWTGVLGACALGVVVTALLHAVGWSLVTQPGLAVYAGALVVTALVSLVVGLLVGAVVGLLTALVPRPAPATTPRLPPAPSPRTHPRRREQRCLPPRLGIGQGQRDVVPGLLREPRSREVAVHDAVAARGMDDGEISPSREAADAEMRSPCEGGGSPVSGEAPSSAHRSCGEGGSSD